MRAVAVVTAICVSIVCVADPSDAIAAEPGNDSASTREGNAVLQIEEVVVTAQRRAEKLQDVPISISVLGGSELSSSTFQGVSEALNTVPGVTVSQSYLGGGSNVAIRGVGASFPLFTGPSPVAYYLDSVPFALVRSAVGPDANVYDLERVEVLRGPQGTLYGSSALNGVVRVITHDPDLSKFDFQGRVSGSGTEAGGSNYRTDAAVNIPLMPGKLAARAAVSYQHLSGWIDQPTNDDANEADIGSYRLKLGAQPTDALTIGLSAWVSRQDADGPNLGDPYDENPTLAAQPTLTHYDAYSLKMGYAAPAVDISLLGSYLDFKNEGTLGLDAAFGIPGSTFFNRVTSRINSVELILNSRSNGPWRWSAGAMYRQGTEDRYQDFTVLPVPVIDFHNESDSYAVYGEITRLLNDGRIELTAGFRHFQDDIDQDGTLGGTPVDNASSKADANTPRAVVTWHVNDRMTAYGSYAEGFRSGFPQDPLVLGVLPTFPEVKPDRLKNYELGIKGSTANGHVAYNAAVYWMDWEDIQLQVFATAFDLPVPAIANGARATGIGADADITLRWGSFSISPYVSWNDLSVSDDVVTGGQTLYRSGERPDGSVETTAGVSADYVVPVTNGALTFSASTSYTSPLTYRSIQGPSVLVKEADSILISRARVAWDFAANWTATLFGDNLGNWRDVAASTFPGVVPIWDVRLRPRTIGLQVEYRLN